MTVTSVPEQYGRRYRPPVRRAALADGDGTRLGWVWTDDEDAAGWAEDPGPLSGPGEGAARVRAGAHVWTVLRDARARGEPASSLLRPELYAPYLLGAPKEADKPGQIGPGVEEVRRTTQDL
ncbi:hypothetical protein NI17_022435 [Thermobifida halotolerans]|uniref:Uncharacterized protein n=1 Tax=Thermobifida halotolerans TaxID=483545 RepID=A0A399FYZ2_9ACTN|nr:hypothetical protein [Thermobifida halotolerans]UOE19444.1 hypothetical protein NI17_022435 [Thermobifida halotolerans]